MHECICICIHVHVVCHVYLVFHEYIHTCVYLFRVHFDNILLVVSDGDDSAKGWNVKFLFENPGVPGTRHPIPPLPNTAMFASNAFLPTSSDIPLTLEKTWIEVAFLAGKSLLWNEGSLPVPPRGVTTGMGGGREHNGSRKRSRNYSRELRERTLLVCFTVYVVFITGLSNAWAFHLPTWGHRVLRVAPLGEFCSRSDRQALQLH